MPVSRARAPKTSEKPFRPRASRLVRPLLADIGLPEAAPFVPDPFQTEAVRLIREVDVLVSAPTGAGKTWIAEQAMDWILTQGGRSWYASPLKALSNAKFLEFGSRFGPERVGILTGDRKENPEAPVIVGTTEILRNQLYDAMAQGESLAADLVILDEAHYLADPDRGVVWEEVIIYLPARVKLLLLSATLANAEELAAWLAQTRRQPCRVVWAEERPVPLEALFLAPDGEVWPLRHRGRLTPKIRHLLERKTGLSQAVSLDRVLLALEELDLLPAIFFLTSRADCDAALAFGRQRLTGRWAEARGRLNQRIDQYLDEYPFLRGHRFLPSLRRHGVASHHAGHLPHFKLLVERLMQEGLLRAIFATSTVAAGVNFPARSVILPQSDRFNGRGFVELTSTELKQMTGRAGRRGMDKVGFVVLLPGPHQDLRLVADLLEAPPEPILSQMQLSFSMVLNLLLSHTLEEVRPVLDLSLSAFQSASQSREQRPGFMDRLAEELKASGCGEIEKAIIQRRRHAQAQAQLRALEEDWEEMLAHLELQSQLEPGRIFLDRRGRPWLVRRQASRQDRPGVLASRLGPKMKLSKGRLRLKFLGLDRIDQITSTLVQIKPDPQLLPELRQLALAGFEPAGRPAGLSGQAQGRLDQAQAQREHLRAFLAASACGDCSLKDDCFDPGRSKLAQGLNMAEAWLQQLAEARRRIWLSFLDRLDFLRSEGFALENGALTEEGRWAAQLRLDHPLVIAEAIRGGALSNLSPALLAGLVAVFVLERERAWSGPREKQPPEAELSSAFRRLETQIAPLLARQKAAGFEIPKQHYAPSLALFQWASGRDWDQVVRAFGVEPGDLAALIFRASDNLRQLAGLHRTHPGLAQAAKQARDLILREPVVVPV